MDRHMKSDILTLSPAALQRVKNILANEPPTKGLRISIEKGGCAGFSYKMDVSSSKVGDEVIQTEAGAVIVAADAILYLLGSKMDVKNTQFSSTFVFENPNQTSSCGCGESFEIKPVNLEQPSIN